MASSQDCLIETVSHSPENVSVQKDVTESTQLVRIKSTKRSLLQKLRTNVLIKSKAINMILFWNSLVYLLYGSLLLVNPENVFLVHVDAVSAQYLRFFIGFSIGGVPLNIIGCVVYGVIAVWLLFYPLAGYLADVRYGRYKVVIFGLKLIWFGLFTFVIGSIAIAIFGCIMLFLCTIILNCQIDFVVVVTPDPQFFGVCLLAMSVSLLVITYFILSIGFAAFAANVIQFGIDQLQELPARNATLFIYWFLLTIYIGMGVGKVAFSCIPSTHLASVGVIYIAWFLLLIILPISLYVAKSKWFVTESGVVNPYREVAQVVSFARKHKIPVRRSAFTYWEDDIPTGLDLGKNKYGGPFTTDQVENVKAFFGILYILLSLGPFFTTDIAASVFLPILKGHMDNWVSYPLFDSSFITYSIFANGGTLYPIFIVILIPIFLKIICPLFQRYIPTILKRIGISLCLITVCILCSLITDAVGHALPNGWNATSVFDTDYFDEDASSLKLSPHILIVQNFLIAVAYILIYGGVFEFICAQSPHSMKGVLIGIFFATKGLFQLIGVLGILLPFSFWKTSRYAGLVYFLVNTVISFVGVVVFTVIARKYQYHQRDDFCDIRMYIEDFYEKEVQHNPKFKELHINFSSNSQD